MFVTVNLLPVKHNMLNFSEFLITQLSKFSDIGKNNQNVDE